MVMVTWKSAIIRRAKKKTENQTVIPFRKLSAVKQAVMQQFFF
jgi:hypothetical protein